MTSLKWIIPILLTASIGHAETLPEAPRFYVYESGSYLRESTKSRLQKILVEHHRLTGEKILLALMNQRRDQNDIESYSDKLFQHWNLQQTHASNLGLLVVLDTHRQAARIKSTLGLEPVFNQRKIEQLQEFTEDHLKQFQIDGSSTQTILEVLKALDSPLVLSGEATDLIGQIKLQPLESSWGSTLGLLLFFVLMVLSLATAIRISLISEIHISDTGQQKLNPFQVLFFEIKNFKNSEIRGGNSGTW